MTGDRDKTAMGRYNAHTHVSIGKLATLVFIGLKLPHKQVCCVFLLFYFAVTRRSSSSNNPSTLGIF